MIYEGDIEVGGGGINMSNKLTLKQEKYVQNLIKGMSQRQAYKNAFDTSKMKDETIDNKAYLLFKKDEVRARYDELVKKAQDDAIMSAIERKKWLSDVIKGNIKHISYSGNGDEYENEAYISDKLKAVDLLNKMDNSYQQNIKIEGTVNNPFSELSTEELRQLIKNDK